MKETGSDVCGLSNLNSYDEINGVTELACVCGNVTHDPDDRDDSRSVIRATKRLFDSVWNS